MRSNSARSTESLLEELQTALSHGTVARRVETLRRVTDLFVGNAVDYSDDHIRVFDDVFQCLIEQIETSARALLAERLAPIAAAPPQIIRTLALDEVIGVSGPVLSRSERLDETTLVEIARTRGQAHLKAISLRRTLSEALTDVLLRGATRTWCSRPSAIRARGCRRTVSPTSSSAPSATTSSPAASACGPTCRAITI